MMRAVTIFLFLGALLSCIDKNRDARESESIVVESVILSVNDRMVGLWSRDSSGFLTNQGFLLQVDGSCFSVGASSTGTWSVEDSATLAISWSDSGADTIRYRIVKMEVDRVTLMDGGAERLFRSVPFGMNDQPQVLSGFAGNLNSKRTERDYQLMLPSAKLIELKLDSDDPGIGFEVYERERRICEGQVKDWKGVIIDPSGIRLKVSHTSPATLSKDGFDYDLKVMGY